MTWRLRVALLSGVMMALTGGCDDAVDGRDDPDLGAGTPRDAAPDGAPVADAEPEADQGADTATGMPDAAEPEADGAALDPDAGALDPDATPSAPDAAPTEPDAAVSVCGDGIVEGPEACDDGNTDPDDYCAPECEAVTGACGDGVVQGNEACDDGDVDGDDYCAPRCDAVTGACGDGVVQANEQCDDGVTAACDATHDGGDGACVPVGECSPDHVMDGAGDCQPAQLDRVVDIFVANDCTMRVEPPEVRVPRGQTVSFVYRNRSRDYAVDVWMSYGGGFLDLETGAEWDDRFVHCTGPRRPRQEGADISTACSRHGFTIFCD